MRRSSTVTAWCTVDQPFDVFECHSATVFADFECEFEGGKEDESV